MWQSYPAWGVAMTGSESVRIAVLTIGGGALAVLLAACSSGGSSGGTAEGAPGTTSPPPSTAPSAPASTAPSASASTAPSASASAAAEASEVFTSARHAYSITVPEGWRVKEYGGTWESLDQFNPGSEIPGEDVVGPIGLAAFMVMDSMAIPEGTTPEEWSAGFTDRVVSGLSENCPGTVGQGEVAGEPAVLVEQPCGRAMVVGRSLVHEGRGYYFTTMHTEDDMESKAILDELVASIAFTD
jgi:hypothetical protein